jgi:hypothetical protein
MFDHSRIKTAFANLAGLRQNDNPNFGELSPSLLYTGDNVLINHPLINIENLDMTARNYGKYVFPAYAALTPYTTGQRVTYAGINYEAIQDGTGNQPDTSPLFWKVLNLLDLFLQDIFSVAAEDTVTEVLNRKKLDGQTKTLMSSLRFYEGVGNFTDLIVNEGDLVGVQIKLLYKNNMCAVLEQIGIQLSAANPNLNFYLYHSSQLAPIATLTKTHTKVSSFQWHEALQKLHYLSADYDAGGVFFLMYDQATLVGQAIKKTHNFHLPPCGWCNINDVKAFNMYSKYLNIHSVRVKAADRNGTNMWDITKTQFTPDNNWGLNFQFTVRCDITDFLISQKDVFQYAVRDMITKKLLEVMSVTTRGNVNQSKIDVLARNELMASHAGGMGFMKQLDDQLKAVNFEFSGLDDLCMPCAKKGGLGYGTNSLSWGR